MSLKSALETAKDILEQASLEASLEEGKHDKKEMKGDKDTETPGLEGGAMSADGVAPEAIKPTDKKAKRPANKSDATGAARAEEDMHGGEGGRYAWW